MACEIKAGHGGCELTKDASRQGQEGEPGREQEAGPGSGRWGLMGVEGASPATPAGAEPTASPSPVPAQKLQMQNLSTWLGQGCGTSSPHLPARVPGTHLTRKYSKATQNPWSPQGPAPSSLPTQPRGQAQKELGVAGSTRQGSSCS